MVHLILSSNTQAIRLYRFRLIIYTKTMRIGIDVSQTAYKETGVGRSMIKLVSTLISSDKSNEYVLFFSSLRKNFQFSTFNFQSNSNVSVKQFKFPPTLLDFLWNKLHIMPIESLIGNVDIFITSDWTEPPVKQAKKVTFIHDLVVYKFPDETDSKIIRVHKKKLDWAIKECSAFICPSESTKKDIQEILRVKKELIHVVNWGI